ncbi:hypothetical protein, partial [Anaplasma bovis]|uniref:hypothetical protein n=1 Tax=Anaplasma bovis TaxID=186733 RepID=UPI002FF38650
MPGDSVIDRELESIQSQSREYNKKMKIAIACVVCVAICTIAAYAVIAESIVLLIALGAALAAAVVATLVYVAYKKIFAQEVQHTGESLGREEALSLLEQDISKDKLKHVLRNASPEALEEVCKKISEVLPDNTSIITQVLEQVEDRKEILELLDLADENSSHVDEVIRRRDFGRMALARRLEAYVVDLATAGNYRKIGAILEYDPSLVYSTCGTSGESIIRLASGNMHTECVQVLKEFHKGIVEGVIRGDDKYRKCDPVLSVLQLIPVDHECALEMFRKLAQSGHNIRSSDLFAVPKGLRKDFEDILLKYCVNPGKIDPTTGDIPKGISPTRRADIVGTSVFRKAFTMEEALDDFEAQLNTLELPFSA